MPDSTDTIIQTRVSGGTVRGSLMQGKRGVIMGVANERSLAWGIASACASQGAELAFTYQGDALGKRVRPLAESVGAPLVTSCDVGDEASVDTAFATIAQVWPTIDFLVHAIGFADKQYLRGRYVDTPREAFLQALDISCYSFTSVARRAAAMMPQGGALLTLTYLGAEKVVPHYNVMGVAKAALEASVRYLAMDLGASGITGERAQRRPRQDPGRERHRRLPLHIEMEPVEQPHGTQCGAGGGGRQRALPAVRSGGRGDWRGASRRLRLPHHRHEEPERP